MKWLMVNVDSYGCGFFYTEAELRRGATEKNAGLGSNHTAF